MNEMRDELDLLKDAFERHMGQKLLSASAATETGLYADVRPNELGHSVKRRCVDHLCESMLF